MMFYVLCGIPASGKTTLATSLAKEINAKLYSYDVIKRNSKIGSFEDICTLIYQRINTDLSNGFNVVYDAPNEKLKYRKDILNMTSNIVCKKILVVMATPLEQCLERNRTRKNRLPDFIIQQSKQMFELPTLAEGWDDIEYYA